MANKKNNKKQTDTKTSQNKNNNKKTNTKNSSTKKKDQKQTKKIEKKETIEKVVEEIIPVEPIDDNEEINNQEENNIEEKLSQTFIEKTKKLFEEHDKYVEEALEEEELEKTQEFENTQLIKIREALKPIGKQKKKRRFRKKSNVDEDFLDVNNKDEHFILKLLLIIGAIALFIWLLPKIKHAINEHYIIDNDYEPYIPEENKDKDEEVIEENPEEKVEEDEEDTDENEEIKIKLSQDEIKDLLASIPCEKLMLQTSTKDYTLLFEEDTLLINSVECYIIDVYAKVDVDLNHVASFAVSIYGDQIFRANTSGGYEELNIE